MSDMSSTEPRPSHGQLPSGVTMDDLRVAITRSGYPLQANVADELWVSFNDADQYPTVQEEWAYVDSETNQVRSIDIFAELLLANNPVDRSLKVWPYLNMLVECKQSEMPYIFFLREQSPSQVYDFPEIGGLPDTDIELFPETDEGVGKIPYAMGIQDLLAFWNRSFFKAPCPLAISVSKLARRGKLELTGQRKGKLELTGEEAYRSLTLPLMKAADHLKQISRPQEHSESLAFRMIICLAVLRAPMFGAYRENGKEFLVPLNWVRVCRLEPRTPHLPFSTISSVRYYDAVHEGYLPEYMAKLLRDTQAIANRVERSADVIRLGKGVCGPEDESYVSLRSINEEDGLGDVSMEPKYRIARLSSSFNLPTVGEGQRPDSDDVASEPSS